MSTTDKHNTITIDDDLLDLLNKMKKENETINDVIRKIISNINDIDSVKKLNFVSIDEISEKSNEILEKYHKLLTKLAE